MKPVYVGTGIDRRPSLSLGRSMRKLRPIPVLSVRLRITGGGVVLRGPWMLRAAVRLPREHGLLRDGPAQAARQLGGVHKKWLLRMGMPPVTCYDGPMLDHWACFAGRGPGEVLIGGRKITGIAQAWRRTDVLLMSGTLLSSVPWSLMCDALSHEGPREADTLNDSTIDVQQCLGTICPNAWAASLHAALCEAMATFDSRVLVAEAVMAAPVDDPLLA